MAAPDLVDLLARCLSSNQVLLGDGGISTQLFQLGWPMSRPPEEATLDRPELVETVHREFAQAGAMWVTTNTFGLPRLVKSSAPAYGLGDLLIAATRCAHRAVGDGSPVIVSLGPSGLPKGTQPSTVEELYCGLAKPCRELPAAGIILETFSAADELLFAVNGCAESGLPIIACLTPLLEPHEGPGALAAICRHSAVSVVGLNCGDGLLSLGRLNEQWGLRGDKLLIAQPNAGLPILTGGVARYALTTEHFADWAEGAADAGIAMIGGCCGIGPAHIRQARSALQSSGRLAAVGD